MGNSLSGLAYFASNEDDPYITLKSVVSTVCVLQCVDLASYTRDVPNTGR